MNKKIIQNKYANYQYSITKKMEAGIILLGWEVKSIRSYKIEINNSYITIKNNEAYLYNTHITPPITLSSHIKHDTLRTRKLLLTKKQIYSLLITLQKKKHTIIPLELYWKKKWIKISIGLAIGKKKYDKRIKIKKKEWILDKKNMINYNPGSSHKYMGLI